MTTETPEASNPKEAVVAQVAPPAIGVAEKQPWWRSGAIVTTLTSILAATVPVTTAVWGQIQKDKELAAQELKDKHEAAMEELKLKHQIEMDYLDRLKGDTERLRTLRMVEETNDDKKLVAWAKSEMGTVEADIDAMNTKIEEQKLALDAAQKQLSQALADSKVKAGVVTQLQINVAAESARLAQLRAEKRAAVAPTVATSQDPSVWSTKPKCLPEERAMDRCMSPFVLGVASVLCPKEYEAFMICNDRPGFASVER